VRNWHKMNNANHNGKKKENGNGSLKRPNVEIREMEIDDQSWLRRAENAEGNRGAALGQLAMIAAIIVSFSASAGTVCHS